VRPILVLLVLLTALSLSGAEQSDPRFEKWLDSSRKVFSSHHLIAYVRLAHLDRKGGEIEFRYDRYPDGIERVQRSDGAALARKKGKNWLESQDWGETGEPATAKTIKQTGVLIAYVDLPLTNKHESRDKSQGADVTRVIDQRKTDEGNEEIVFELGREHQTQANYPKYTFFRYKDAAPDDVILSEFSGPIYDSGGGRVQLDVRYEFMIAVKIDKMNVVTPTPSNER